ncbi:MAG: CDC48 family AAA ATPase [Candidatus ainarchaeum sp.]|nr:CDC48 family AAA ATPase [Candidatus ainarchaeum sp.]
MVEKIILTVKETDIKDALKGIAKLDPLVFDKMKLTIGDVILIEGSKRALAYATRGTELDAGLNQIKIDGIVRHNSGASIDDSVFIEKANVLPCETINLAPIIEKNKKINLTKDVESLIKEKLLNINIVEKNIVKIPGLPILTEDGYRDLQLIVNKTIPKNAVRITENTKVIISEKAEDSKTPSMTYDDIGGLKKEIEAIREMVELPIKRPEIFKKLGISPPKGVLLYGPPGTGKTLLAKAVASETDAKFITINGPEIVSGVYGKSEENLRDIFKDAEENAPAIIFIDEIDAIAPKRENIHGETEKRVVAQLLTLMDGLTARGQVVVIAATNIPDSIDPALRRPGRFDRELEINVPDKEARKEILQVHIRGMPIKDLNIDEIIEITNGFSGADISALCKEAALKAIKRLMPLINKESGKHLSREILDKLIITHQDFLDALNVVEPSALREVQVQIPTTTWEDIGGLDEQKQKLKEMIEWPLKYPDKFKELKLTPPAGVLLYGPPGTGKTLIAKAIANESSANFISIKGPEIFNKWVGESEKKIRDVFKKARQLAPAIIFFDEIDAITVSRKSSENLSGASNNVVAQLLTEMDGVSKLKDIVIIGATNRLDIVDAAFLRPGRFDLKLEIPNPDLKSREKIFEVYLNKMNTDKNINIKELSKITDGFSGAEIEAVVREAGMDVLRENIVGNEKNLLITEKHIKKAIKEIKNIEKEKGKNKKNNLEKGVI